jgi:hypothetical protein
MFSILTSKIFGGLALGLAMTLAFVVWSGDRREAKLEANIAKQVKVIAKLRRDNETLKGNVDKVEGALAVCNAGVDAAARTANAIGRAGAAAVEAVQKAGGVAAARSVAAVKAMPAATCQDAEAILRSRP